jgi:hypothetical protein
MRAKSNIGVDKGGFNYQLQVVATPQHPDIIASVVSWGDAVDGSAREVLAEADSASQKRKRDGAIGEACDFLLVFLADGPKPKKLRNRQSSLGCRGLRYGAPKEFLKSSQRS